MTKSIANLLSIFMLGGCASALQPDEEPQEMVPKTSAELYLDAEAKIAQWDIEGAKRACTLSAEALREVDATPEDQARTAFCFAEIQRLEYEALPVDATELKAIKEQTVAKIEGTKRLQATYQDIHKYQSATWTVAAGVRNAQVFEHFADALRNMKTPPGFDEEASQIYRTQLEGIALPVQQEAQVRYKQTAKYAKTHNVDTSYAKIAIERAQR